MTTKNILGRNFKEQHHHFSSTEWTKTYVSRNTSNKALINFGGSSKRGKRKYETYWDNLPDILLEKIFSSLSIRERFYASLVCKSWNRAFYLPDVWSTFILEDSTLTRARFNYYQGWQYVLDHVRTQLCLTQVGSYFKCLIFAPMLNFFNLYEFMNMLSWYIEQGDSPILNSYGIGAKIHTLKFTFPCNMDNRMREDEITKLFGTGGRLLGALKRLMTNLPELQQLELVNLMLEITEAQHLLDGVCDICCTSMRRLVLINTTKMHYQLLHLGVFLNLNVLVISPQNLGDDVVELLGYTKLQHLHIHQNMYTPSHVVNYTSTRAWKNCRKTNHYLQVHLEMANLHEDRMLLWPAAPVTSVIYASPPSPGVQLSEIMKINENYKANLLVYGHLNLPRFYRSKKFFDRVDEPLVLLCRGCPMLQIVIITERVCTATLLIIATTCKNLKQFYVRRNAVIKKCDWPRNPNWSDEFIEWLKYSSSDYLRTEMEISQILGFKWSMLSDRVFCKLTVNVDENEVC